MFFALWPDRALQNALASAAQNSVLASGGRAVPPENLHITLAFLGSVPQAHIEKVAAIAAEVAHEVPREPLRITLDVIEYWKKPKLLCATSREPATQGEEAVLADALKSRVAAADDHQEFRPHVTLARKVHHPPCLTKLEPVTWSFTDFVLVGSKTLPQGSVYTVLERFPLRQ